ncbi:MAG: GAF domain-containing protein [Psychromonas sp.]|nr:GAF domain-containing protein [Psychromonas sp.]
MSDVINETALAIALKQGSATTLFKALQKELEQRFNIKLLTFTQIDMVQRKAKRLYSSDDDSYAIGGFKPIEVNDWTTRVIEQQQAFVANEHSELAKVFFDHQLIAQLGLGSVINWPVVVHSQVIGTVNLLAEEGAYQNPDHLVLEKLTPWFAITFLFKSTSKE